MLKNFRQKSKKQLKRITALVVALLVALQLAPVSTVSATETAPVWVSLGNSTYQLYGTDVTVQMSDGTITVSGTGAIPSYTDATLSQRPWNNSTCTKLVVESTITSLGDYSFSRLKNLNTITLYSTTFLEDNNVFAGIAGEPVFYIKGYNATTRYIGTIPYTSIQSIQAYASQNSVCASFLLDEWYMVELFQNSTNPTIKNVYCRWDSSEPWEDLDENSNGGKETEVASILSHTTDGDYEVTCYEKIATQDYYAAFASVIDDYTLATTYEMTVTRHDLTVNATLGELFYEIEIPQEYQVAGRSFRIISIAKGVMEVYDDLDLSDSTITYQTNTPSGVLALVYKDVNVAESVQF